MSITIKDIAKKANVSPSTVSRVLNDSGYVKEETRLKINEAIIEMNYTPSEIARSLSRGETNTIGVIIPDITNAYFGEIIQGISHVAEENDLNIIFYNTDNNLEKEIRALNILKEQRIKGVIMTPGFGAEKANERYKKTIESLNCPVILAAADVKGTNLNGVFVDNIKGAFDSTSLLIKEQHKKIGIMLGFVSSEPMSQRLTGYKKSLEYNNIKVDEKYIYHSDYSMETSYRLAKEILGSDDKPTALIVCTSRMTMGVLKAIEEEKMKIPDDISIISSDKNELLDMFGLNITYIDECPVELGKKSMEMLCDIIKNKSYSEIRRTTIEPKIKIRGSEKKN
ncbi:MAG: LacI family DNA-binding transcriptional regulator [Clostridium sp.]|nr:LacI family DNA-binding transcriptional regulator [Clostridium sp.]